MTSLFHAILSKSIRKIYKTIYIFITIFSNRYFNHELYGNTVTLKSIPFIEIIDFPTPANDTFYHVFLNSSTILEQ